jgi:D-glycero-D-manno-heptose 1,7-bisphosphate phosphatase
VLNQAVIFCGGFGTRLLPLTKKIPKPMVMVGGKPFLHHLISQSKQNGIKNFLILCGYKHKVIKKYFGDVSKFGVNINYHYNEPKVETFKRLLDARHLLEKSFLLLYGDNYSSLNLHDLTNQKYHKKNSLLITVCKKKRGNIQLDKKKKLIKKYFFNKNSFSNYVEIGYIILEKNILPKNKNLKNISFNKFINYCVINRKAFFYLNDTGYLSISDFERLQITRKFFKQKIILLDRDGVINYKNTKHYYVRSLNELKINFRFIKKYYKLLKNKKIICITNQAGIATGDLTKKNLILIHKKIGSIYKKKDLKLLIFL